MRRRTQAAGAGVGVVIGVAAALWWRRHPSACPYELRFSGELPHPFITRARLREILAPQPGERVLEVGPGPGYYSLDLARAVEPGGTLELFDLQQEMLDHTLRKARSRGLSNITSTRGDAQTLPYPANSFDAACLNVTLGEVPDQQAALRELRRVLKPSGRLVVGEILVDVHYVPFETLRGRASEGADFASSGAWADRSATLRALAQTAAETGAPCTRRAAGDSPAQRSA